MKVKLLKNGKVANFGTVAANALIKAGIAIPYEDEVTVAKVEEPELPPAVIDAEEKLDTDSTVVVKKKPGRPRKENVYQTKILTAEV